MRKMGISRESARVYKDDSPHRNRTTTFEMRLMRVRKNATARERRRLAEVNRAYTELSRKVPQQLLGNATKLEVLRGATQYIQMLTLVLDRDANFEGEMRNDVIHKHGNCESSVQDMMVRPVYSAGQTPVSSTSTLASEDRDGDDGPRDGHDIDQADSETSSLSSDDSNGYTSPKCREMSILRCGILKFDDPPPKANISWR